MNTISNWLNWLKEAGFSKAYIDRRANIKIKEDNFSVTIGCDDYSFLDDKVVYFQDSRIESGAINFDLHSEWSFEQANLYSACINAAFNPFYAFIDSYSSVLIDSNGVRVIYPNFEILNYGVCVKANDDSLFLDRKLCRILMHADDYISVAKYNNVFKIYTDNIKILVKSSVPESKCLDTNHVVKRSPDEGFKNIRDVVDFAGMLSSLHKTGVFLPDSVVLVKGGAVLNYYHLSMTVFDWSRPNVPRETTI